MSYRLHRCKPRCSVFCPHVNRSWEEAWRKPLLLSTRPAVRGFQLPVTTLKIPRQGMYGNDCHCTVCGISPCTSCNGNSNSNNTNNNHATVKTTATVKNSNHCNVYCVFVQVQALFERVESEQGRLDILVNNAFALGPGDQLKTKFWKQGVSAQQSIPRSSGL